MRLLGVMASLLLAPPALAQRTWVVDWQMLPGADFSDIQPAVDAASVGDTIQIRPNNPALPYGDVVITQAVNLSGEGGDFGVTPPEPGVWTGNIRVLGIPANSAVTIHGIGIWDAYITNLKVLDCAGPVLMDRVQFLCIGFAPLPPWSVERSSNVTFSRARLESCMRTLPSVGAASRIVGSHVIIRDSVVDSGGSPFPAAYVANCDVLFVDTDVTSGGLAFDGARLWFAGTSSYQGSGICVGGGTTVRVGPNVAGLTPGTGPCTTVVAENISYVDVQSSGLVRGGPVSMNVYGSPGATAILVAGAALGSATSFAGLGDVWVDTAMAVEVIGTYALDNVGAAVVTGPQVPASLGIGLPFAFQAIVLDGGSVTTTHPMFASVQ